MMLEMQNLVRYKKLVGKNALYLVDLEFNTPFDRSAKEDPIESLELGLDGGWK